MTGVHRALLAAIAVVGFASVATAADMPVKARVAAPVESTWTGFYAGVNAGWGWSKANSTATPFGATAIADFAPMSVSNTAQGSVFGGQLGYNWQLKSLVLGVEGDFDGAGINGSAATTTPSILNGGTATDGVMVHEKINWLASVRGRIGYTWGPGLAYATGGAAWENVSVNTLLSADTAPGVFGQSGIGSFSTTKSGWVVGAGYEWMVAPHWTVRGEYLHYGFGSGPTNAVAIPGCAAGPCGANVSVSKVDVDVVRLGVNYMFNGSR
jgi:outer membrane immunogenic protein